MTFISPDNIIIEPLSDRFNNKARRFVLEVFHTEQGIPKQLIPLESNNQYWWSIRIDEQLIGTAVTWLEEKEWHWGRFAIEKEYRKMGLGKKLAFHSIQAAFEKDIDYLIINARDITVKMLENWGGKITAEEIDFYGAPVFPMILQKDVFIKKSKNT